jgi:8-oxo-dGTP diphosphatase
MSKYPNTFYRVSVKALVRDELGKILVCKENSPHWSLPGGGVDHGEEPLNALRRELHEELGLDSFASADIATVLTVYVEETGLCGLSTK